MQFARLVRVREKQTIEQQGIIGVRVVYKLIVGYVLMGVSAFCPPEYEAIRLLAILGGVIAFLLAFKDLLRDLEDIW